MNRVKYIILLAFLSISIEVMGQSYYESVNKRIAICLDEIMNIGTTDAISIAPASMLNSQLPSISSAEIKMNGMWNNKTIIPENGKSSIYGQFQANSFLRTNRNTAVLGSVQYSKGIKHSVLYNETTDYALLQPYVLIDTLSGNVQFEQYAFHGEWMKRKSNMIYSLGGSYSATHEYRTIDPRPRNIASNFKAEATLGTELDCIEILTSLSYRKYHQSQNVTFMSATGANTVLFHATGLGNDYYRFRSTGIFAATRYIGQGVKAGVTSRFLDKKGQAGVSYEWIGISRRLQNQNEAPISKLQLGILNGFISFRVSEALAFFANYYSEERKGFENVIDCATSGIYKDILPLNMYNETNRVAALKCVFRANEKYRISPSIEFLNTEMNYVYPSSWLNYSSLAAGVKAGYLSQLKNKWLTDITFHTAYKRNLTDNLKLNNGEKKLIKLYEDKYNVWTQDQLLLTIQGFIQKETDKNTAIYSKAAISSLILNDGRIRTICCISIGLSY